MKRSDVGALATLGLLHCVRTGVAVRDYGKAEGGSTAGTTADTAEQLHAAASCSHHWAAIHGSYGVALHTLHWLGTEAAAWQCTMFSRLPKGGHPPGQLERLDFWQLDDLGGQLFCMRARTVLVQHTSKRAKHCICWWTQRPALHCTCPCMHMRSAASNDGCRLHCGHPSSLGCNRDQVFSNCTASFLWLCDSTSPAHDLLCSASLPVRHQRAAAPSAL